MKFNHAKPTVVEADMTPMIDMTFQLIAFFMIVTNFDQTQADERIKLPADKLARPPKVARENEIVLNIGFIRNSDGTVKSGPFVFYPDQGNQIRVADFKPHLDREFKITSKQYNEKKALDTSIVIRSDGDVPTGMIQELIKMGKEVGYVKFSLKAKSDIVPE